FPLGRAGSDGSRFDCARDQSVTGPDYSQCERTLDAVADGMRVHPAGALRTALSPARSIDAGATRARVFQIDMHLFTIASAVMSQIGGSQILPARVVVSEPALLICWGTLLLFGSVWFRRRAEHGRSE